MRAVAACLRVHLASGAARLRGGRPVSAGERGHPHSHRHGPGGHAHAHVAATTDSRRLTIALSLIVAFMALEVIAGIAGHSLALLSDAAHTLTDAAALALSLLVIRLVRRPAGGDLTFGLRRAENSLRPGERRDAARARRASRLRGRPSTGRASETQGAIVLAVALVGIGVNILATAQLAKANRVSMNIEGSFQHLLTDLYAFVATAVAGGVILLTGFRRADAIAALLVAALMLRAAYALLRDSGRVLLEAAPAGMSVAEIGEAIARHPGVDSVHDLHVWELGSGFPSLSAHILVPVEEDCHGVRREIEALLADRSGSSTQRSRSIIAAETGSSPWGMSARLRDKTLRSDASSVAAAPKTITPPQPSLGGASSRFVPRHRSVRRGEARGRRGSARRR